MVFISILFLKSKGQWRSNVNIAVVYSILILPSHSIMAIPRDSFLPQWEILSLYIYIYTLFTELIAEHVYIYLPSNLAKRMHLTFWSRLCFPECAYDVQSAAYIGSSLGFGTEPVLWLCLEALKSHSGDAKCDRLSSHTSASHVLILFTLPSICMRKALFCSTTSTEKS